MSWCAGSYDCAPSAVRSSQPRSSPSTLSCRPTSSPASPSTASSCPDSPVRATTWWRLRDRDSDDAGDGELEERQRHQPDPGELLQLVLAQPGIADPQPDDDERQREHL